MYGYYLYLATAELRTTTEKYWLYTPTPIWAYQRYLEYAYARATATAARE